MNADTWAIRVECVSKKFGLTLGAAMKYGLRDVADRVIGKATQGDQLRQGEFWAVHDVTFELYRGEALGIMGVNGCGKTTLLRMLNGTYAPDAGRVLIRGRVGALIAAGAGFAPMLSGRENVYVNGALLGLSTREIDGLMDEIVAFSELEKFIDLPVKNYSSGMYVRLGFAIAALTSPDVLLMDEVMAVGDMNFQKKCFDHVLRLKKSGTAIILVSHSPGQIWSVCDRGIFMDRGKIVVSGSTEDTIRAYEDQNAINAIESAMRLSQLPSPVGNEPPGEDVVALAASYGHDRGGTGDVVCKDVRLLSRTGHEVIHDFSFAEPILIVGQIVVKQPQDDLLIRFTVDSAQYRFISTIDSYEQGLGLARVERGVYRIECLLVNPNFRPGAYTVNVGILKKGAGIHLYYQFGVQRFRIKHPSDRFLYSDSNAVMHIDASFKLTRDDKSCLASSGVAREP